MCGIVGIHACASDNIKDLSTRMNHIQIHRGPDSEGVYLDESNRISLAMRRLAIIDVVGGGQPIRSKDGRYVMIFNGEIVNSPDLRRELESEGETFETDHSDTEVLFRLICRDGMEVLPRLNGMFAFVIYDSREGTLTIARDRFGIKPIYYSQLGGRFAFASELKSLLTLPFMERQLNEQSLFNYLSLMYVPGPETIFAGIKKLEPAHYLTYCLAKRQFTMKRWWRQSFVPDVRISEQEWAEQIRYSLGTAVKRWTLSDVPIACSLSGGLDSSAIVGLLAESGQTVSTYSLGFKGQSEEHWNELPLAVEVSRKWGTRHHELILEPAALLTDLGRMVWHMDEPYGGGLPSWAVFRQMSEDVKVGLSGTGGDELFGNYGKWAGLEGGWMYSPRPNESNFRKLYFERYYYFSDHDKRAIFSRQFSELKDTSSLLYRHFTDAQGRSVRDRCAITDIGTQLTDEFLAMTDRFSMAHSLEVRPPFLDNDFVDLISKIPSRIRTNRRDLKGLLRKAVAPILPNSLLKAPKKGFVIPLHLWLSRELLPLAKFLLDPNRLASQGIFRSDLYSRLFVPYLQGRYGKTTMLWGLLMFQMWHLQFIEGNPKFGPMSIDNFVDLAR